MHLTLRKQNEGSVFSHPLQFHECVGNGNLAQILSGRGPELHRGWSPTSLVLAVGDTVLVRRGRVQSALAPDSALLLEDGAQYTVLCQGNAQGFVLMFGNDVLATRGASSASNGRRLLSEAIPAGDSLLQPLIALYRRCRFETEGRMDDHGAAAGFLYGLRQRQLKAEARLARCPGRTQAHKRDVLARLSRVAAMLDAPGGAPADLATLAELANYSPTHFLRLYTAVYGASPHDYQVQVRLERAHRLVVRTSLAVRDIAEAVGFDSRSTFNRLFRRAYGQSAADLRERPLVSHHRPAPAIVPKGVGAAAH